MDAVRSPDIVLPTFIPPKFVNLLNTYIEQRNDGKLYLLVRINEKVTKELVVYFVDSIPEDKKNEYVLFRHKLVRPEYKTALKIQEISKILDVDQLMIERSQNGRLADLFRLSTIPENPPLTRHERIRHQLSLMILEGTSARTQMSFDMLRACFEWCEKYKKMLEGILLEAQSDTKNLRYIVVKKHFSRLPYNLEYRQNSDVRLRIQKDARKGTLTRYSYHLDLFHGDAMLKGKRFVKNGVNPSELEDTNGREIDQRSIVREAEIINRVNDIDGVIKYVRAPELHCKVKENKTIFYSYIFVEFLNFKSLIDHVTSAHDFSDKERCKYMGDLCLILDKIHKKGIFHRDLKPENIMFHKDEEGKISIKIIDFDLSEFASKPSYKLVGSPHYLDPYQYYIHQEKGVSLGSVEADIYGLGMVAYGWMSGMWPKIAIELAGNKFEVLRNKNNEYDVEGINASIKVSVGCVPTFVNNPVLGDVIMRMMEALPNKRIQLLEAAKVFYQIAKIIK